jgi:hypothetical protein
MKEILNKFKVTSLNSMLNKNVSHNTAVTSDKQDSRAP